MKVYTNERLCSVCGHLVSKLLSKMLADSDEDHFNPSVRVVEFEKSGSSNCGFYLTRGKWDPYPWVSRVDDGSLANLAGLKTGDCLLEVCGEDVVGRRISEIAEIVKSKPGQVSLLVWNAGVDPQCTPEALCCGPIPSNLQRLSACMSTILAFLECPVCLETIAPPTYQCDNGHLICIRCRMKSERCPVCRHRLSRGRSLLSDQVYHAIVDAFNLRDETDDSRAAKIQQIFKPKSKTKNVPNIKVTQCHTTKFLAKLVGKASSVENLSTNTKFLNPNGQESTLKVKSLSSNEIFNTESPTVSRSGSVRKLNRLKLVNGTTTMDDSLTNISDFDNRENSYPGSLEFLEQNAADNNVINDLDALVIDEGKNEDMTYYCPFEGKCQLLLTGDNVTQHFQTNHSGPLVQYFGPHIDLPIKKLENETCFMIHHEEKTFFIKSLSNHTVLDNKDQRNGLLQLYKKEIPEPVEYFSNAEKVPNVLSETLQFKRKFHLHDTEKVMVEGAMEYDRISVVVFTINKIRVSEDLMVWAWYLGGAENSNMFEIEVELKTNTAENSLLRIRNPVHSLNSTSFQDIMDRRKCIFFSSSILKNMGSIQDTVLGVTVIFN